ncbi:MAG: PIG-L family deacetylase [Chitinophagales bacterium]|nr:PIG-L family deacetylase [Chitinophagales bacterium]
MKTFFDYLLIALFFVFTTSIHAQTPIQKDAAQIYQDLLRFDEVGTVLYVAAHPDDENTRLLSWLVNEKKVRTAYVALTRGDGGQNLIGNELGFLLGAIRTQELLDARNSDGAEQYFTRALDFGFSKNPEETLQKWSKDSLLEDLVVLIRTLRPDVIICRFPTTGEGGHGHHTTSAILAQEAFDMAANKNYHVTGNLPAWQVKKLFWNTFRFSSGINTTSEDQFQINVGKYNPLLGNTPGEIASRSRSFHKSQGFGTATTRGDEKEYFIQLKGKTAKNDLFEDINTSWSRISGSEAIQKKINQLIKSYNFNQPSFILPGLLQLRTDLLTLKKKSQNQADESTLIDYKLKQVENLIQQSAGLWWTANTYTDELSPGDSTSLHFEWIQRTDLPVTIQKISIGNQVIAKNISTADNQLWKVDKKIKIPENTSYSSPYWLSNPVNDNLFQPEGDVHGNAAYIYKNRIVKIDYSIDDKSFTTDIPIQYRYVDPVKGEFFNPVVYLPKVTMEWSSPFSIHPNGKEEQVQLTVTAHTDINGGRLNLSSPEKWNVVVENGNELPQMAKGQTYTFHISISSSVTTTQTGTLTSEIQLDDATFDLQLDDIVYEHISRQTVLTKSQLSLTSFPLDKKLKTIGYIVGAGDLVPKSLTQLGYRVVFIDDENIQKTDLNSLDAIVTGIRAYNTNDWLNKAYVQLMEYVQNGGNLIVQYNTNSYFGPLTTKMFPFQAEITRDRVTVEEASVTFVDKNSPVINQPNKITQEDFDAWVQERGLYFVGEKDAVWKTVFSMHDPNERPSEGSLIWTPYGKGNLVYTGLSFFRQLPAGVPGAYRLFVNLLELPKNVSK